MGCKLLFSEKNTDGIRGISIGKICASSRGKTGDASVIRNDWA
jgi:hypothetical protein